MIAALGFMGRPGYAGARSHHPVHTVDPDRGGDYSMCGVELIGMSPQPDPEVSNARACARCATMRELAEERAERRGGIVGGWEHVEGRHVGLGVEGECWNARDSLRRLWVVSTNGGKSWVAAVWLPDGTMRYVRKVGNQKRSHWPTDAKAMAACEELARQGDYVLDRPRRPVHQGE
jgi:hypothetical protein